MMSKKKFYRQVDRATRQAINLKVLAPKASKRMVRDYNRRFRNWCLKTGNPYPHGWEWR